MQLFIAEDCCLYIAQAIDFYKKGNVQEAIQMDQYLKWLIKYLICFYKF